MISYEQKEKKFNFRVGGILESPDRKKVLIHRLSNFNFWLLPGGRVEMLEDTENAILREIQEELGVTSEIINCNNKCRTSCNKITNVFKL